MRKGNQQIVSNVLIYPCLGSLSELEDLWQHYQVSCKKYLFDVFRPKWRLFDIFLRPPKLIRYEPLHLKHKLFHRCSITCSLLGARSSRVTILLQNRDVDNNNIVFGQGFGCWKTFQNFRQFLGRFQCFLERHKAIYMTVLYFSEVLVIKAYQFIRYTLPVFTLSWQKTCERESLGQFFVEKKSGVELTLK